MGWLFNSRWETKQDVFDQWRSDYESAGYTVQFRGSWAYVEKDGNPQDLIYVKTQKIDGEWGYKDESVTCGPLCYSVPLWMVLKVHQMFKSNKYYLEWLENYPKKANVLQNNRQKTAGSLSKEERC